MKSGARNEPTTLEQLQELERELEARQRVSPMWFKKKKITAEQAKHRLACLQAVIRDFKARHNPTSDQGSFGI